LIFKEVDSIVLVIKGNAMIKVLIVDDHNIVRTSLRLALRSKANDISIVGEAETGEQAIDLVRKLKPDVVLMDIEMPGMNGLEATQKILRFYPALKIIALTAHEEEPFPASFLEAGASGYLTKNTDFEELIEAIRNANADHPYITPSIVHRLVDLRRKKAVRSPFIELSQRELQVMWMIIRGIKTKDIAEKINLSPTTVSTYRKRIFQKLNVKSDIELIRLAIRHGILDSTHIAKK
jgi:two-component system invasion response regulator UvrY